MHDTLALETRTGGTPTVVLVHGACSDAGNWSAVIRHLQATGLTVVAPANPLRGLAADTTFLAAVVADLAGPVLLVGESYAGAVIGAVAACSPNVVGLVHLAGLALEPGESGMELIGGFPDTLFGPSLRQLAVPTADGGETIELHLDRELFHEVFAGDLPPETAAVLAAVQRPLAAPALYERATAEAWSRLPCWYLVATADQAIHPEAQRFMARRMGAVTVELPSSHAVVVSQPLAVAELVRSAVVALV